jgi:hypothetical protein
MMNKKKKKKMYKNFFFQKIKYKKNEAFYNLFF